MIFRDLEQKIVQDLNTSGMSIDAIYFIMKSIMAEIEQRYFEFCRQEDIERAEMAKKELEPDQINEESSSEAEEPIAANINEKGTK
jgi:hypothetical protein